MVGEIVTKGKHDEENCEKCLISGKPCLSEEQLTTTVKEEETKELCFSHNALTKTTTSFALFCKELNSHLHFKYIVSLDKVKISVRPYALQQYVK